MKTKRGNSLLDADFEVIMVGSGIVGLYATYRLRKQALRVLCIKAAPEVGGSIKPPSSARFPHRSGYNLPA